MPLSKQAKALYEAALRRKGLQPGKAVRQDPRTFVGPIQMYRSRVPSRQPLWSDLYKGYVTGYEDAMVPTNTYMRGRGRFEELDDELSRLERNSVIERDNPIRQQYYRFYNSGDIPSFIREAPGDLPGIGYNDRTLTYRYPLYGATVPSRKIRNDRDLTRLGRLELEARMDEAIENEYKDYLRKMYSGKIPMQPGYSADDLQMYLRKTPAQVRREAEIEAEMRERDLDAYQSELDERMLGIER